MRGEGLSCYVQLIKIKIIIIIIIIILIMAKTHHLLRPVAVGDLVFNSVGDDGRVSNVHVGPAERDGVGSHPMNSDSRRSGRH